MYIYIQKEKKNTKEKPGMTSRIFIGIQVDIEYID